MRDHTLSRSDYMILWKSPRLFFASILVLSAVLPALAQIDTSIENIRLAIPQNAADNTYYSFKDELAAMVQEILDNLWIEDIYVGVVSEPEEGGEIPRNLFEMFTNWIDRSYFTEVAAIDRGELNQAVMSPNEIAERPVNVKTEITLSLDFYDVETRTFLGSVLMESSHFGGDSTKSRKKALKALAEKTEYELKRIFWFNSEIVSTDGRTITVNKEALQGAYPGTIYAVHNPPDENDPKDVQGRRVGFAVLEDTAGASLKLIRVSGALAPGSYIIEHPDPLIAVSLDVIPPLPDTYMRIGLNGHMQTLRSVDLGGGLQFIRMLDSFQEYAYGLGFTVAGTYRFHDGPSWDFSFWGDIALDIPFKRDDDGIWVSTLALSTSLGVQAEVPINARFGFYMKAGYRFGLKTDTWTWSEEEEDFPAFWFDDDAPSVNSTGIVLGAGIRFYPF
jgi:hypothetical protein